MTTSRIASHVPEEAKRGGTTLCDPVLVQRLVEASVLAVAVATGLAALLTNLLALWPA